ncbi:MAG: ERF family protein [Nitrospira sp.]|nr:ERF family protein [Nitrospira sp.]MDH5251876.1 ERF family protein [Nitrospira sp.]
MQSSTIAELAKAIAKAQSELKPVKKETINPFYGKKYADLASVWEALAPFHANGIAITQMPYPPEREGFIGITTQLSHISGEWIAGQLELPIGKPDAQGAGSAITYARRYALGCMTGVVTEEDDDGNTASQPHAKPSAIPLAKAANEKKLKSLKITPPAAAIDDVRWTEFLDYAGDDPDRMNVITQLKEVLAIGMVSDLQGAARTSFIKEFQESCKVTGVPCEEWVKP